MAYKTYHKNKKTGVTYVYEAVSYWDKEKRQSRNKQVCIGKLDPETGEFIPSKRLDKKQAAARDPKVTATSKVVGPSLILDKITKSLGLDKILSQCFPDIHEQILSMAYYLTARGGALSQCGFWAKSHSHPGDNSLDSRRISEILKQIDFDSRETFFSKWCQKIVSNDYLFYDITSVSSYSELNDYVKYGYNRDNEKLPQINLGMLFSKKSLLPVYYKNLPGNISDVSTLGNIVKMLDKLNFPKFHFVLDRGFYSKENIDNLMLNREKFTIAVPTRLKWVQEIIDDVDYDIQNPEHYRDFDGEVLYTCTKLHYWGENRHRGYVHVYYNSHIAAEATDKFNRELLEYKKELESGSLVKEHQDAYDTFFIIKDTPVRGRKVSFNNEMVQKYRKKYSGYYVLFSNGIKDSDEALQVYRNKDSVEKCFDDLKNRLDMKRLRVHSAPVMESRIFVQFISLIYLSELRNMMRRSGLDKKYSARDILLEMETLSEITYSGKYGKIYTEATKQQKEILDKFNISLDA